MYRINIIMINIAGIDFSLTCPCISIFKGTEFSFKACQFYFLTSSKKKYNFNKKQFIGIRHNNYINNEERYDYISDWVIKNIPVNFMIVLEGFSYGSIASRVFDIGAATGVLKHKLYKNNYIFHLIPPKTIKKFATSNGGASKLQMADAFIEETNRDLYSELMCTVGNSPVSDIIDSYYLCKYGYYL